MLQAEDSRLTAGVWVSGADDTTTPWTPDEAEWLRCTAELDPELNVAGGLVKPEVKAMQLDCGRRKLALGHCNTTAPQNNDFTCQHATALFNSKAEGCTFNSSLLGITFKLNSNTVPASPAPGPRYSDDLVCTPAFQNQTLAFVGDSIIRDVYNSFIVDLTRNFGAGARSTVGLRIHRSLMLQNFVAIPCQR